MTGTRADALKEKIKYTGSFIETTMDGTNLETPRTLERKEGWGEK